MISKTTYQLKSPQLHISNLLYKATQIRPTRIGGIRLEHQQISGKHIFHNYGHGGAGISLAYGSSYLSAKHITAFQKFIGTKCAVIGAGIIGINTAIQLAKRGNTVNVYAQRIPKYGQAQALLASQVAAGKWFPGGYDYQANALQHEVLSKLSFDYYIQAINNKKYKALKIVDCYDSHFTKQELQTVVPSHIIGQYKQVNVSFQGGIPSPHIHFKTISIDVPLFLDELITEAKLRGVNFILRKFKSFNDILSLQQKAIWNCSGLASRQLFSDKNMYPAKGHLLYFKNPLNIDYIYSGQTKDGQRISIYGCGKRLIVGLTYLKGQEMSEKKNSEQDEKYYDKILKNALTYFNQKGNPVAKL